MLKDLAGKTVYDLEDEEFRELFCRGCKKCGECAKDPNTIAACIVLVDDGAWDRHYRTRGEEVVPMRR